jgi:uncharacterized protein
MRGFSRSSYIPAVPRGWRLVLPFLFGACTGSSAPSRGTGPTPPGAVTSPAALPVVQTAFTVTRAMIPMRDEVKLETVILAPSGATKPLPILLSRSPYGVPVDDSALIGPHGPAELVADGYIFVYQNLRGRFGSEGTFVMARVPRHDRSDPRAIDESTDAYDTIEWLLHHVAGHNGRVGMTGASYAAWTATMALLDPHPALRAILEQASPADQFIGDDFHHNGAFRLSYAFEFCALVESSREKNTSFVFNRADTYDWYLALGPLANANDRYFYGRIPTWNDFIHHPNRDEFWQKQAFDDHLSRTTVPIMHVGGFWDQEDFYGPQRIYELLERTDVAHLNYLTMGPWNHGGWLSDGRKLGDIEFGRDTGRDFRADVRAPWFARWLHDSPVSLPAEAKVFVSGKNEWRTFDAWPPAKETTPTRVYLRAARSLSFDPPTDAATGAYDEYVSDPENPVPYTRRPIRPLFQEGSDWPVWEVGDQRFVDRRPDVLSWQTEPLQRDVVIAGDVVAELYASTSGSDADWIVKLIDVYPEMPVAQTAPSASPANASPDLRGYQLMIAGDVMRGRFRNAFARPEPVAPGKMVRHNLNLHAHAHAFLKGHRIMVQVQSTWFPLIDRNPQKYVENIYAARQEDFVKATHRIARSKAAPSAIVLPVLPR